ncbi:MAG: hypothetical protein IJZ03_04490 [Clostridia bacterium]|nr:hypothetical protein [Clostridia bacterium]
MKRITAIILSLLMIISVFVGCQNTDTKNASGDGTKDPEKNKNEDSNEFSDGWESYYTTDEAQFLKDLATVQLENDESSFLYIKNGEKAPEVSMLLPKLEMEGYKIHYYEATAYEFLFKYLPSDFEPTLENGGGYNEEVRISVSIRKENTFEKTIEKHGVTAENGFAYIPESGKYYIDNGETMIVVALPKSVRLNSIDDLDSYITFVEHTFKTAYFESAE